MPHYNVVIETQALATGGYRADVAEGPSWLKGMKVSDPDARHPGEAVLWLKMDVRAVRPDADFDFIHAPL